MTRRIWVSREVLLGFAVFAGGVLVGAALYAEAGPIRVDLEPEVRAAGVVLVGAIVAALFALAGAFVGSTTAAKGNRDAARIAAKAARDQRIQDDKRVLARRIVSRGNRHAQEVANQVYARHDKVGQVSDPRLPEIGSTALIEDAINELYLLEAQRTADLAHEMFRVLLRLDEYAYVDERDRVANGGQVRAFSQLELANFETLRDAQRLLKTLVMNAHLVDAGGEGLVPGGALKPGERLEEVLAGVDQDHDPSADISSSTTTAP